MTARAGTIYQMGNRLKPKDYSLTNGCGESATIGWMVMGGVVLVTDL